MLRSILFNILFFGGTTVGLTVLSPVLILSKKFCTRIPYLWSSWVSSLLKTIIGVTYRIKGREHLPKTPVLLAIKHQSTWETLALNHILDRPVFILKKELLWIFPFGAYLQAAGMIALDRRGTSQTIKNMIKQAKDRVFHGRSIIIFPEGSRSAPGTQNPYKKGIYMLYKHLNIPIVPVALNSGVVWPRRTFQKNPGTIDVVFLPPIPPGKEEQEVMNTLEHVIESESRKLLPESTLTTSAGYFVDLHTVDPTINVDLKYRGNDNFVGRPIDGYYSNTAYCAPEMATILHRIQSALKPKGLGLVIWDAYRPLRAGQDFKKWCENPHTPAPRQKQNFPSMDKSQILKNGYLMEKSGHSRGAAVDLTLKDLKTGELLDMGTEFDFMGTASHWDAVTKKHITKPQHANRLFLRTLMMDHGLVPYDKEWWHFNFPEDREPYPRFYFDFVV